MTVAALPSAASYIENGVTTAYPAPFRFLSPRHLAVSRILADGTVLPLALGTNFAVSGGTTDAGGTVTVTAPAVAGTRLVIRRQTPRAQQMVYAPGDRFPAKSHEAALDLLTLQAQEAGDAIDETRSRALMVPPGELAPTLPPAPQRSGRKILGFNAATGAIEVQGAAAFKGDPGGNAMAIGLFASAEGMDIPAGVDLVQTSGLDAPGKGPARYAYLPGQNLNGLGGRTRFKAKDGRMFALVGDTVSIDTLPALTDNVAERLNGAYDHLQNTGRTSPPGQPGWGVGRIAVPKGSYRLGSTFAPYAPLGFSVRGAGVSATAIDATLNGGVAFYLTDYNHVEYADFSLTNRLYPGTGTAFNLYGEGGGGMLTLKRLVVSGFNTFIKNNGDVVNGQATPGNGDKTLVEQVIFATTTGYDQTRNNQAIGFTFLNCASACGGTTFKVGGAGETLIMNHVGQVFGRMFEQPEGSGNPGNYWPNRITMRDSKAEYYSNNNDDRLFIDASASRNLTNAGGSNVDYRLHNVSLTGGPAMPDIDTHVIIRCGSNGQGTDSMRVYMDGGWLEGVLEIHAHQQGVQPHRWAFRDMLRAPNPATVNLQGEGSHYLLEWRGNENVPLDQYRGGQSFIGTIDPMKAYVWRYSGKDIINTAIAEVQNTYGSRVGKQFSIGPFHSKMTVMGLCVFIDGNSSGTDTEVSWFSAAPTGTWADGVNGNMLLGTALIPGDRHGLVPVMMYDASKWQTTGYVHVRITKPATGQSTQAGLLICYCPMFGTGA